MKTNREAIKRGILGYVIPTYTGKCVGDINLRNSLGNLIVEKLKKDFEVIYEEGNGICKKIVNSLTPICHSIVFKDKFVTGKIRVSTGNCGTPIGLKIKLHKNTTKRNLISHVKEYDLYEKVFYRLKGNIPEDLIELVNAEVSGVSIDTNTILYKKLISQIVRDYPKKMELFNKKLEVVAEVIAKEFRKYSLNQKNYIKKLSTKTALMNYSSLRIQLIEDEIKMMDQNIFNFESSLNKTIVNENSDFKTWVIYFTKDYRNSDEFYRMVPKKSHALAW